MPDFLLPDLGEGLVDAEVTCWLVAVGDIVTVDQPVVELETAKAAVEVPIPFAGRVAALFAGPGDRVAVGAPLIGVELAGSQAAPAAIAAPGHSGNVLIGYGTSPARRRPRRRAGLPSASTRRAGAGVPETSASPSKTAETAGSNPPVISPVVRRLAREHGVDLPSLRPSDPSGVIRRLDVEHAMSAAGAQRRDDPGAGEPLNADADADRYLPLTGLRGAAAALVSRSRREIPEATVWVDADATGLLAVRQALNDADPARPVSLLALIARFCVAGIARYPELNSRIEDGAVHLLPTVNLGFAAQTDRGLVVPVVRSAHRMSTRALSAALSARIEAARAGRLSPVELTGGTFTVNNYGLFGVDGSAAIINHPEVAILGIGRIVPRPWVVDGALAVRSVAQLTLSFDHRACDGAVAGGFLRFVADCVEAPIRLLGDV